MLFVTTICRHGKRSCDNDPHQVMCLVQTNLFYDIDMVGGQGIVDLEKITGHKSQGDMAVHGLRKRRKFVSLIVFSRTQTQSPTSTCA